MSKISKNVKVTVGSDVGLGWESNLGGELSGLQVILKQRNIWRGIILLF